MTPLPSVDVRRETIIFPTHEPHWPDRNPMFLEKRVYQGSSGRVYPLPFTDRISEKAELRAWDAVVIENDFLKITILPALGGRIHRAQDKTNGYDLIYYQPVIKPALVGLAGPWASGGIEFNWPQHHRPSTFMPADVAIEKHADGSATVWLSEHDPMARMKGMHGVRLHPGKSTLEIVARVYNRTADVQTFLWWANVATQVHEQYQSFFPPDATHVADHAKRAVSTFPHCQDKYYGVDYGRRGREGVPKTEMPLKYIPPHGGKAIGDGAEGIYKPDDLSWYANIPVPTSYMCMGSTGDFAGGYDHRARAGIVQVTNHHISPGKKQWTWGNHEFGYAWDRNLTQADQHGQFPPYIELMVGVYTDNQPDFSFLQPGETKSWSQFWYPLRAVGPVQKANVDAAVSFRVKKGIARIGVVVTARYPDAIVRLSHLGDPMGEWTQLLSPERPLTFETIVPTDAVETDFTLLVLSRSRVELIVYRPEAAQPTELPAPAAEPAAPEKVISNDELFIIGSHLEQYRHATRLPDLYWREALRRDPGDTRCNLALGRWHLRRGEFAVAERFLQASISRATSLNPNPYDGEAYYQLGSCLRYQAFAENLNSRKLQDAYAAFYKATWNQAWQSAGYHALAEIDVLRHQWPSALDHLTRSLQLNTENLRARDLKVIVLRKLGHLVQADELLRETLALDPLDWWARFLAGDTIASDQQVKFDLALDCIRAGLWPEALALLADDAEAEAPEPNPKKITAPALPTASLGTAPLLHYYRAWICSLIGDPDQQRVHLTEARKASPDYCFPARLEEILILENALTAHPEDARALYYLGNLLYDRRRHPEAIRRWERAVALEPSHSTAWRNLGIGYFNINHQADQARVAYERAFQCAPGDARILYERDQLWKRTRETPAKRLHELIRSPRLVQSRDDLAIELCALYNQTAQPGKALGIIAARNFQPWEGGEGQALGQHVRTHRLLGRAALKAGDAVRAQQEFLNALHAPPNLGEANHLLANQSDLHYWLGWAFAQNQETDRARSEWRLAAEFKGDFQGMSVRTFSEMTYYSALSLEALGQKADATQLLESLLAFAQNLAGQPATVDYFATSLPTMLLFEDDLSARQEITALLLEAQANLGLGRKPAGIKLLKKVLQRDPSHALAADLLSEENEYVLATA